MFTISNNKFNREEIIKLAELFKEPSLINGDLAITSMRDFRKYLEDKAVDTVEIVGEWGKRMTWMMGRNCEWSNSAGIVSVEWL